MELQPIRIPSGWEVLFNNLTELEPDDVPKTADEIWNFQFVQDILYIRNRRTRKKDHKVYEHELGIDLGWYPDGDPEGFFRLVVVKDGDWENPLRQLESRKKAEIVSQMEEWLLEFSGTQWMNE
ncbi:hypothetical protein C0033_17920 [Clostridium sp. chh4-2]|uniref:hypothetical protein n=1 Tax=Clostridium sp. chh4-2 TaxID=2067550 RepID=UPI000CCE7089|nr:hypothetical protein [Clostridium sp. chh4-2]PNV60641.1 hypothetical protein C0033_17920 [Clostridium sp. chh4-2]